MKSIQENITVDARNRVPRRLRWENRTYRVRRLLDYWILQTRWWGREEKRIYFRLETNRGIVEVYRAAESLHPGLDPTSASCSQPTTRDPRSSTLGPQPSTLESPSFPKNPSSLGNAPLPIEGDTHTRERRRTDAAYRPDVRIEENLRRKARAAARERPGQAGEQSERVGEQAGKRSERVGKQPEQSREQPERVRWVLSKLVD